MYAMRNDIRESNGEFLYTKITAINLTSSTLRNTRSIEQQLKSAI